MTSAELKKLREPFKPEQIGKLPKPTKKENPKGKCDFCGGWHGLPAIHLDYVGHASVTDRILSVDPGYEFGPVLDINKRPIKEGTEMLHYLTICGATRYEWGEGPNMKEISSDAIRRCAMRFGVALDLWAKEPLTGDADAPPSAAPGKKSPPAGSRTPPKKLRASQISLLEACKQAGITDDLRHRLITMLMSGSTSSVKDLDDEQCDQVKAQIVLFASNLEGNMRVLEQWEAKR